MSERAMARSGKQQPKRSATRWALAALAVAVVLLVGLTLHGLRNSPAARMSATGSALPALHPGSGVPPELAREVPPWQATHNTAAVPPGTVPVWRVDPPRPDPSTPLPPTPVEPPNPALHRAPLHNPGGVNRDRPERSVPGLE